MGEESSKDGGSGGSGQDEEDNYLKPAKRYQSQSHTQSRRINQFTYVAIS